MGKTLDKPRRYPGSIRLSRFTTNDDAVARRVHIELEDTVSSTRILEVYITPEELGLMLTGSGVDCEFEVRTTGIGQRREHKEIHVPIISSKGQNEWGSRSEIAKQSVAPFEVDGWKASSNDFGNQHKHNGDGYRVGFSRLVPASDKDYQDALDDQLESA